MKNIIIVGAGTAGVLSAAICRKIWKYNTNISVYYSSQKRCIGVGESVAPGIIEFWKTSITHIAFTTKNIEEVYDKIKSTGGKHKSKIWHLFDNKPYRVCYCEDPWGNIIELSSHPYSVIWSNYSKPHLDQKNKL